MKRFMREGHRSRRHYNTEAENIVGMKMLASNVIFYMSLKSMEHTNETIQKYNSPRVIIESDKGWFMKEA